MTQIAKQYFNYNSLPDRQVRSTLCSEATAIKAAVKRTHDNLVEIGNRLIHAKEIAGHGHFLAWVDAEFGMSDSHARRFMNVAEAFGKSDIMSDLSLPQTAIFMLAAPSVSEETREVAVEMAKSGELKTVADAKALVEAGKTPQVLAAPTVEDDGSWPEDPFDDADVPIQIPTPSEPQITEPERDPHGLYVETTTEVMNADLPAPSKSPRTLDDYSQEEQDDLSNDDWLELLPLTAKLGDENMDSRLFAEAAVNWRALRKLHSALRREVNARINSGAPDAYSVRMRGFAPMPHPKDWKFSREAPGGFILW